MATAHGFCPSHRLPNLATPPACLPAQAAEEAEKKAAEEAAARKAAEEEAARKEAEEAKRKVGACRVQQRLVRAAFC